MENEAASVQDSRWALETRLAANRFGWRQALSAGVLFALLGAVQELLISLLLRVHGYSLPEHLWIGVLAVAFVLGVGLGRWRFGALEAGAGALAYLPGAWLFVVGVQALPGSLLALPNSPAFDNHDVFALAVLAALGARLGQTWAQQGRAAR
ncbi:hypothetical protein [Deinococcus arcticus]|uniref:Uncharacterized protein n=1 Tax=Deinococcus arcticus TaxID=2136176 RepID=A0A2T3WCF6_9DEIO|nr:hypothetical protein [Deinococcus arcticus]PTA69590.1 hypothetical protein C8263_00740 [Deinococcus arcticus]